MPATDIPRSLPNESLKSLFVSLMSMLPEDTSPRVIVVKPEVPAPTPVRPNGTKAAPSRPTYDPAFVALTELATVLAIRDQDTVATFGRDVAGVLQSALRDREHVHPVAVSRLTYYLLSLLKASTVRFI